MKDINDQKIQEMAEKDLADQNAELSSTDDKDLTAYSMLFEALDKEPVISLPYNFSASVTGTIRSRKNKVSDLWLYFSIAAVFIVLIGAAYFYLNSINSASSSQVIMGLLRYKWILIFGTSALLIIQFLDQKLSLDLDSHD